MGQLLSLPLSPLLGESYVSRFESSATQLLGDRRPQFPYLYNGANKCCLTSAHEFLGGSITVLLTKAFFSKAVLPLLGMHVSECTFTGLVNTSQHTMRHVKH